jgi:hypothetical protein
MLILMTAHYRWSSTAGPILHEILEKSLGREKKRHHEAIRVLGDDHHGA